MITAQSIYDTFKDQNIENNWKDTLQELSQIMQDNVLYWIHEKWDEFAKTISPIETEEELKHIIIVKYIEFKSHWFMLNTYIQYQMFLTGIPDEETNYKASVISQFIGFLENFIDEDEIYNINQMLADPIQKELKTETQTSHQSMEEQLIDLYDEKNNLKESLGTSDTETIIEMVKSLEEQLNVLYEEKETNQGDKNVSEFESLEDQLNDLYEEKEILQNKYGTSSAIGISNMIDSLEDQLKTMYEELENGVIIESKKITILGSRKIIIKK